MSTSTWHLERANQALDEWYTIANQFLQLASKYNNRFGLFTKVNNKSKRDALVSKTLGLIYHDRYKLLLDRCWRK